MKCTVVAEDWKRGKPESHWPVTRYTRMFATYPEAKAHLAAIEGRWADPAIKLDIIVEEGEPKPWELGEPGYRAGGLCIEQYMNTQVPFEYGGRVITYYVSPCMQSVHDCSFETHIFENTNVGTENSPRLYVGGCVTHHRNQAAAREYHTALVEMLINELPASGTEFGPGEGLATRIDDMAALGIKPAKDPRPVSAAGTSSAKGSHPAMRPLRTTRLDDHTPGEARGMRIGDYSLRFKKRKTWEVTLHGFKCTLFISCLRQREYYHDDDELWEMSHEGTAIATGMDLLAVLQEGDRWMGLRRRVLSAL